MDKEVINGLFFSLGLNTRLVYVITFISRTVLDMTAPSPFELVCILSTSLLLSQMLPSPSWTISRNCVNWFDSSSWCLSSGAFISRKHILLHSKNPMLPTEKAVCVCPSLLSSPVNIQILGSIC